MSYYDVMNEDLPNSKEFGFDGDYEAFRGTEGYHRWQIAMSEWSIRRNRAECERHGAGDSEYAAYVRRSTKSTIAYEERLIAEHAAALEAIGAHAA